MSLIIILGTGVLSSVCLSQTLSVCNKSLAKFLWNLRTLKEVGIPTLPNISGPLRDTAAELTLEAQQVAAAVAETTIGEQGR